MHMIGNTNIEPLLRAFKRFEAFLQHNTTEQERAGIVHAFEACFDLSWKTMKRLLDERGSGQRAYSPNEVFRIAALDGLIADEAEWLSFLQKRNLTIYVYDEHILNEVLDICAAFSASVQSFLHNIKTIDCAA
jgi:nucleotidyltransferase substrate binding protein (TIGR01987 family)